MKTKHWQSALLASLVCSATAFGTIEISDSCTSNVSGTGYADCDGYLGIVEAFTDHTDPDGEAAARGNSKVWTTEAGFFDWDVYGFTAVVVDVTNAGVGALPGFAHADCDAEASVDGVGSYCSSASATTTDGYDSDRGDLINASGNKNFDANEGIDCFFDCYAVAASEDDPGDTADADAVAGCEGGLS